MEEIKEGSLVMYSGTETAGVVKVIKEMDGEPWALIDTTGLFYHLSTLEPIERMPEKKELGGYTVDEVEEHMAGEAEKMDTIRMEDESVESGG